MIQNQLHTENWSMLLLEPASHDTGQIELTCNLTRLFTSMLHKYLALSSISIYVYEKPTFSHVSTLKPRSSGSPVYLQ